MRLNKTEREEFGKRVKILIPQMEKSEIVNHIKNEGYPRRTQIVCNLEGQSTTKRKLVVQPPGHLPERISSIYWQITAKDSVNDVLVVS